MARGFACAGEWMERVPVESLPTDFSAPARAIVTARRITEETFGRETVNPVVLREDSGELTVYTLQGTREHDRPYFGGDLRVRFGSVHSHVLFHGPLGTELALMMLYPFLGPPDGVPCGPG
ncbi:hypothetical protein NVS55_12515 [Myxococcus stipitatus]|uniref:hypothetical protein n=1 Tax=Myxococcus stipitatus TaxID=83455 RepID=UPI0031452CA0